MMARTAREGRVAWIGLRPGRREPVREVQEAEITPEGPEGDHGRAGKRALTLLQAEHLGVLAALLGREAVAPALLRRNLLVSGLNLLGFRKARLRVGPVLIEVTGPCPPCSRMEEALGHGGYTAMRGHGGVYAEILEPGRIAIGDVVRPERG
ncbi:MOSC domain-containing protein [Ovoidimarina sediminis]|uniref:MOSC domain-containing protein n=1 Tax=Ovoidimarina sediminis TaxID=3079856 RepID=UPI00290C3B45|nr:MOSC domain-containing protein [Rhodophyticola sp. MJ-SS7]MDU8945574.1 MOSC domain-containing protein [Rhodophyticola sp. MJ-SS7]